MASSPTSDAEPIPALLSQLASAAVASVPLAAAAGAATLSLSSQGSLVVVALLLGVANRSIWSGLAGTLAAAAVAVRFATTDLSDLAGLQSVLGAAGTVGPTLAAASAWTAAAAVILAIRAADPARWERTAGVVTAVATGACAAVIAVGEGPGGRLEARIAATLLAAVLAGAVALTDRWSWSRRVRPWLAVLCGAVAIGLAAWPS